MSKGYRRTRFYFPDSYQGKYIFIFFIIAGVTAFLFTILFIYFSSDTVTLNFNNGELNLGKTPEIMIDQLLGIHGILICIGGIAIIYFGTRFTHRTAGPLHKIEKTLDHMIQGSIDHKITLRKHDECKSIAEKLNHFNTQLVTRLIDIRSITQQIASFSETRRQSPSNHPSDDFQEILGMCEKINVILSGFTITHPQKDDQEDMP